jgi:hypothetical protein
LWEVSYYSGGRPEVAGGGFASYIAQTIIGKLKDDIHVAVPTTGQTLTFTQQDIKAVSLEHSIIGSLFDSLGEAAEAVAKDIDETPPEEFQKRVQDRADKIRQVRDAVLDSGLVPVSDTDVKRKQSALEVAQTDTKIQQARLEQEQTRAKLENLKEVQADAEPQTIKAQVEKIQQLTQERDEVIAGIDDEDMKKKVKMMAKASF